MKSDDEIETAITRAHSNEAEFAQYLRARGLRVTTLSQGFRASITDIVDYAHDVDLDVEGYRCQYKHRHSKLAIFASRDVQPFVDEKVKADRTPVDFYILRFSDGTIVVPYEPSKWGEDRRWDPKDRAFKVFYTVEVGSCVPLETWIESFSTD